MAKTKSQLDHEIEEAVAGYKRNRNQLARLGVGDVRTDGRLFVGMRVRVADGHWQGRTGTINRIQRDASGPRPVYNVLVDLDGTGPVVFDRSALSEIRSQSKTRSARKRARLIHKSRSS
jgi:hypothetical protein